MSQTQILLYNFKDEDRLHQIRRYLNRHRISVRMVQQPEYLESLGFLFEIPGFSKNPVFNLGKNFQEEMMVLKDFSSEQLDEFLAFFKENGLLPVNLKAMLTPVTVHWDSLKLHDELMKAPQRATATEFGQNVPQSVRADCGNNFSDTL